MNTFQNDMINIINIREDFNIVTFTVLTDDISLVNLLRRSILSEIETYTIDIVVFHTNTSPRHDEILALRFGQLIIDHTRFQPPEGDFETIIDIRGPKQVTTNDIPELPFAEETPIFELKAGQRVHCKLIVKLGTARTHVKWRPVSVVSINQIPDTAGYQMSFKNIGMMPSEEIIRKGVEHIKDTITREPLTIFSRVLTPQNLKTE